jgi:hypothetical protein
MREEGRTHARRKLSRGLRILYALALSSCVHAPYRYGDITDEEIRAVTPLVRQDSRARIVSYKRRPDGTIEVQTKRQELYRIRKIKEQWKVFESLLITY